MSNFSVRVELHNADWAAYERLHVAMQTRGFNRFIIGDDGRRHRLPTAEYDLPASTLQLQEVTTLVHAIASTIRPSPMVLVTQASARGWILPAA